MLIGRAQETRRLAAALGPGVVSVVGPPGVGKSALARAALPADVIPVPAGPDLLLQVALALGISAEVDPGPRVVQVLGVRPRVLLFDDVDESLDALGDVLDRWLELVPGLCVVTTSCASPRRAETVVELSGLGDEDGAALLVRAAGPRARLQPDDPALRALSRDLDGLPLALVLAGERLRLLRPEQLRERLGSSLGGALARSVDGALDALSDEARAALDVLSGLRGSFDTQQALSLLDAPAVEHLLELRDASLLMPAGNGFRLLRVVRERVGGVFGVRHADAVLEAMAQGGAVDSEDLASALGQVPEERLAVLIQDPRVCRLVPPGRRAALLADRGLVPEVEAELRLRLGELSRAEALAGRLDGAAAARIRAHVAIRRGALEAAEQVLADALKEGCSGADRAWLLLERGLLLHERGQTEEGLASVREAREAFESLGESEGAVRASLREALLLLASGRGPEGVAALLRVEDRLGRLGHDDLVGIARWWLAFVSLEVGDDAAAADWLDQAEEALGASGDPASTARVEGGRGVLALLAGDLDEARRRFEEASLVQEPPGRPRWSVLLLEARGILAARQGEATTARRLLDRAVALAAPLPRSLREGIEHTAAVLRGDAAPETTSSLRARLQRTLAEVSARATLPVLRVGPEARWFALDGEPVDLSRRGAPRRILAALVDARDAGEELDVHAIVAAGWPGEELHPEAGRARAYTAIRSLRRFGLEEVLVTRDEGYVLEAAIQRS